MKQSPHMQQVVQRLTGRHRVDLFQPGAFLRLDMPGCDSLVFDNLGQSQIAIAYCFEQRGEWCTDREVIFFVNNQCFVPIEITQAVTGWMAFAKIDTTSQQIVRINQCNQAMLAEFTERWAHRIEQQNWLERGIRFEPWVPPSSRR